MFSGSMYEAAEEKQTVTAEDHARVYRPYQSKDGRHWCPLGSTEVTGAEPQNLPPSSPLSAAHKKDLYH